MADVLRRALAAVSRSPLAAAAAAAVDAALPPRRDVLTILTYHRVDEPAARPDLMPSLVSPRRPASRRRWRCRWHFDPVGLPMWSRRSISRPRLPPRAVLVTFDDGYRDFAAHAWPTLRTAGVPATLFVATAAADDPTRPFWWDRLWSAVSSAPGPDPVATPIGALPVGPQHARRTVATIRGWLKTLAHDDAMTQVDRIADGLGVPAGPRAPAGALGWDDLRRLASEADPARHTRQHRCSTASRSTGRRRDRRRPCRPGARDRAIATIPRVLATERCPRRRGGRGGAPAGMDLAMTTERGGNDLRRVDRLRLRRINVGGRAGVPLVRAQLAWAGSLDARRADLPLRGAVVHSATNRADRPHPLAGGGVTTNGSLRPWLLLGLIVLVAAGSIAAVMALAPGPAPTPTTPSHGRAPSSDPPRRLRRPFLPFADLRDRPHVVRRHDKLHRASKLWSRRGQWWARCSAARPPAWHLPARMRHPSGPTPASSSTTARSSDAERCGPRAPVHGRRRSRPSPNHAIRVKRFT